MTHVKIPIDVINGLLAYLVRQPYEDVAGLVAAIKSSGDESFASQQAELRDRSVASG